MKLLYVANIRLPTEKAHGLQIMKTCEAFVKAGVTVELVVPRRNNSIASDPHTYYGISERFSVTYLPVWDTVGRSSIGFLFESMQFAFKARRYARRAKADVVFGRDELILWALPGAIVWETHTGAWNMFARKVARRARTVIAISQGLKDFYVKWGVPAEKIIVAHDAVDIHAFDIPDSKEEARRTLGLSSGPLVIYTGSRQAGKGVEILEAAHKYIPDIDVRIISGEPHTRIPLYLRAADVLVLPNSARARVSSHFTSPMKLFEYLAAGKPIVAANVSSVREVVDESCVYFFEPDNPQALAATIQQALSDSHSSERASRARECANTYSWDMRASRILAALKTHAPF